MESIKAVLHGQIAAMVEDGRLNEEKEISVSELAERINKKLEAEYSVSDVAVSARDAGYRIFHRADVLISLLKTSKEIEDLKIDWAKDPIWDIEETDTFEAYAEYLRAWCEDRNTKLESEMSERNAAHTALVREQTGVLDADIVSALHTWNEIENEVERADKNACTWESKLAAAQVRATLLQAAQLKRVADALDALNMMYGR